MRALEVVYFREGSRVPMVDWLAELPLDARDVCIAYLRLLKQMGFEARRPIAGFLGEGIHELRAKRRGVNYRMLYFFHGRSTVVVSHGFVKQRRTVPRIEIQRAVECMARFEADPVAHAFRSGV
jgi:phage-related protein